MTIKMQLTIKSMHSPYVNSFFPENFKIDFKIKGDASNKIKGKIKGDERENKRGRFPLI